MSFPFVSIIIPCRNEEKHLPACLNSLIQQDYSKEKLEILVVDGKSEDKTKGIVEDYIKKYPYIRLFENPQKFTPHALNLGIKNAKGEIIMRADAHAEYAPSYVSQCVKYLQEYNADNVGGVLKTVAGENTLVAKAIAIVLSHPFGTGGSRFRVGSKEIKWVETVFGGCYKREVFEKIGLFNEALIRSQDLELNLRLKKAGGKILLVPEITVFYYPKSKLTDFLKHEFRDGAWSIYPLRFSRTPFRLRHYLPLFFAIGLIGGAVLSAFFPCFLWLFLAVITVYLLISLLVSFLIAKKEKEWRYFFLLPVVFFSRHFAYGLGSFFALIKVLLKIKLSY